MESLRRSVLVLVVLVSAAIGTAPRAGAVGHQPQRLAPATQVVLRSSFQVIRGVDEIQASGDYVLVASKHRGVDTGWVVINSRRGSKTVLDPQCHVDAFGPPWLLTACPTASHPSGPFDVERYSLIDGTRRAITPAAGVPQCQWPPDYYVEIPCASEPDGVGAYWIRWDATCYNCGDTVVFQNIRTGEVRNDPTNATTYADLNSPALARRTCPGVRLVRDFSNSAGVRWGSLTRHGQWALVRGHNNSVFLERCGTRMRERLLAGNSRGPVSNATAIVWQAQRNRLSGLFLPSLQTFTIPLPSAISQQGMVSSLALNSEALYVRDGYDGRFWRTASPAVLPRNTGRPGLTRSGATLTCLRGRWSNAERFSYAWQVDGITHERAKPTLAVGPTAAPLRSESDG